MYIPHKTLKYLHSQLLLDFLVQFMSWTTYIWNWDSFNIVIMNKYTNQNDFLFEATIIPLYLLHVGFLLQDTIIFT